MLKHQEKDVLERLHKVENFDLLYQEDFLNWTGCTYDTGICYSEVIARELLSKFKQKLRNIGSEYLARKEGEKGSYYRKHKGVLPEKTNKGKNTEKRLAIALFNASKVEGYEFPFGKIIDYQTPLKRVRDDKWGEIDLLTYDSKDNILTLIELKAEGSKETFLRSVLEIYTYYKQIMKIRERFLSDFNECKVSREARIVPGILVHKDSNAGKTGENFMKYCYQYNLARYLFFELNQNPLQIYLHDIAENNKPPQHTCASRFPIKLIKNDW